MLDIVGEPFEINWAPTEAEELIQNVKMIVLTERETVPLARDFGITSDALDMPQSIQKARLSASIVGTCRKYEPRVKIKRVEFEGDENGLMKPIVKVEKR